MLGLALLKRLANAGKLQYAYPSHLHNPTLLQAHDFRASYILDLIGQDAYLLMSFTKELRLLEY